MPVFVSAGFSSFLSKSVIQTSNVKYPRLSSTGMSLTIPGTLPIPNTIHDQKRTHLIVAAQVAYGDNLLTQLLTLLCVLSTILYSLYGFESYPGHVRKLPMTLVLAMVCAGYSDFLTSYNWLLTTYPQYGRKSYINEIPNSKMTNVPIQIIRCLKGLLIMSKLSVTLGPGTIQCGGNEMVLGCRFKPKLAIATV